MSPRATILILLPHYLPGTRYGGPVRTVANLVSRLGDEFDLHVLSLDHDLGEAEPYPLPKGQWLQQGNARVMYLPAPGWSDLRRIVRELQPDTIQLNSLFHPRFAVLPAMLHRMRGAGSARLLIAPRGELAAGALALKALKKSLFLRAARWMRLYHNVEWQAASRHEVADIQRVFGPDASVTLAPNLPAPLPVVNQAGRGKQPGELKLLFLGRVSPMKHLAYLLDVLGGMSGDVALECWGPLEDRSYWQHCQELIAALPAGIRVEYMGEAATGELPEIFARHHLLALPTQGENYGHAIVEALLHSLPVLISDRTPWRGLEAVHAGWDLPLADPEAFREVLGRLQAMGHAEWLGWSEGARRRGEAIAADAEAELANRRLLAGGVSR